MKMLALEFSTAQRSVAVAETGQSTAVLAEAVIGGETSAPALGLIDAALRDAGVKRESIRTMVIGLGPGSYTGIRIALALAQGWQLARAVTLLGISSVEALARRAKQEGLRGRVHLVIDAQREEFYLATYELTEAATRELEPLRLAPRAEILRRLAANETVVSPDATQLGPAARTAFPRASDLAQLAAGRSGQVSGESLEPIYLRETAFVKSPPPRKVS